MQSLTIGLLEEELGWIQILKQEGLSYRICDLHRTIPQDDFGVLVLNRPLRDEEKRILEEYLLKGGGLLTDLRTIGEMRNIPYRSCRIESIVPTSDPLFRNISLIDLGLKGSWSKKADLGRIRGKRNAIYRGSLGKGFLLALPFDVHRAMTDQRTKRKAFYFEKARRFPDEKVSLVSKGEVRRLVSNCLLKLFHQRGLPYLHLSYYPDGFRNALVLRMDADLSGKEDIQNLYELAKRHGIRISWFIHMKQGEKNLKEILQMEEEGHEIGVHGYLHRTYPDYRRNLENIQRARDLMKERGLHPIGFSSPFGIWNENLGRVLEDLEFEYSSEFGLNYDDLPFYPLLGDRLSKVLQVPVHPISIGNLRLARFQEEEMILYYQRVMNLKWIRGEPLIFYSHPEGEGGEVIESIIRYAEEKKGFWRTDLSSFMRWWKEREKFQYQAEMEGDRIFIHPSIPNPRIFYSIHTPEGKEALIPSTEVIELREIPYDPSPPVSEWDEKILRTKRVKGLLFMRDLVSWFYRNRRREI